MHNNIIASLYPNTFNMMINIFSVIRDHLLNGRWRSVEDDNVMGLIPSNNNFSACTDTLLWRWEKTNTLSIKLIYHFFNNGRCQLRHAKAIWRIWCPLKIRVFLWLLVKEAILIWDNLQKRGWIDLKVCVLCGHEDDQVSTSRCLVTTHESFGQLAQILCLRVTMLQGNVHTLVNEKDSLHTNSQLSYTGVLEGA